MSELRKVNVFRSELTWDEADPAGYVGGYYRFGGDIGASMLGATVYELPPGQSNCPYHYEYGNEEWLLVLEGSVTVRQPEGEDDLGPGDVACFRQGPEGAHKLTNRGEHVARLVMFSTKTDPSAAV